MRRLGTKLLIGLVVAVALALGASSDMRAAAKAAAKAAVTATTPVATSDATAIAAAKASAKTVKPKAAPAPAVSDSVLPSTPLPGSTLVTAAPVPQAGTAQGKVTRGAACIKKFQKVAPSDQKAATLRARALGVRPGVAGRNSLAATLSGAPAGGAGALCRPSARHRRPRRNPALFRSLR